MVKSFLFLIVVCTSSAVAAFSQASSPRTSPTPSGRSVAPTKVSADENFLGVLDNGTYRNSFFKFTLPIPEEYIVQNRSEIELYSRAGTDLYKSADKRSNKALEDAVNNEVMLLSVALKPLGSAENGALIIGVRKQMTGVTANMVLAETVKTLTTNPNVRLHKTLPAAVIGGKSFVGVILKSEFSGQTLDQRLYVTMHKGYAFSIGATATTDQAVKELDAFLRTLDFPAR